MQRLLARHHRLHTKNNNSIPSLVYLYMDLLVKCEILLWLLFKFNE